MIGKSQAKKRGGAGVCSQHQCENLVIPEASAPSVCENLVVPEAGAPTTPPHSCSFYVSDFARTFALNTHTCTSHFSRSCVLRHAALPCLSSSFPISTCPHLYVWQARRGVIHALTDVIHKYIYADTIIFFFWLRWQARRAVLNAPILQQQCSASTAISASGLSSPAASSTSRTCSSASALDKIRSLALARQKGGSGGGIHKSRRLSAAVAARAEGGGAGTSLTVGGTVIRRRSAGDAPLGLAGGF